MISHTSAIISEDNQPSAAFDETVAPIVKFRYRKYTDVVWGVIYLLSYIAFIATGSYICSQSHPRFNVDSDGVRTISEYYEEDAMKCCEKGGRGNICFILNANSYYDSENERRLQEETNSRFNGDEGIFDAFLEAPEIIIGLLSITFVSAVTWVLLIRYFSKTVVLVTEVAKVGILITLGITQGDVGVRVLCFLGAVGLIIFDYWTRKQILLAADVMQYSTVAMKANPSIFVGSFLVKLLFAGNAVLFVTFFARSFDVAEVMKIDDEYCEFGYPSYVIGISTYLCFSYLWTIMFFGQIRLSIIATIVGSWHFHSNDQPGLLVAIINAGKSLGTLSVSSLITAIAEKINRILSGEDWWKFWFNPMCCVTAPINLILCLIGNCFKACIHMLTKSAVILHVFTGESFMGSAKSAIGIMRRHFKGGFVTETTSKSVLHLSSYAFSIGISLLAWTWVEDKFDCKPIYSGDDGSDRFTWILWLLVILFNLWFPVLGLYVIIIVNKYQQKWESDRKGDTYYDQDHTNHLWIPPLAGAFVGCIAMMFFTFLADIFHDIISTMFLCFAIDKDNYVESIDADLEKLVERMPNYIQASDVEIVTGEAIPVAPAVFDDSAMPSPSAPPLENSVIATKI